MVKQTTNKLNGEVEKALYAVEDLMVRLQIPMILHKDIAKDVHNDNGEITAKEINVLVKDKSFTPFNTSMLHTLRPKIEKTKYGYYLEEEGVPVHIHVYKRNWPWFKRPDLKFYKITEYWLPNPFEGYWKARYLIR